MRRTPVGLFAFLVLATACDDLGDPLRVDPSEARVGDRPPLAELISHPGASASPTSVAEGPAVFRALLEGGTVVYDAIPTPLPGSYPSLGYQATRTDEWGDLVLLTEAGTVGQVTVGLNSWACENDATRASTEACVTTPGATFPHPITINLYEVDRSGADPAVGPLIATRTETFDVPFRPSWDEACLSPAANAPFGGQWFDPVLGECVNGFAVEVVFDFVGEGVELPQELIFGVAFDSESAGDSPLGVPGPYNSLNMGAAGTGTAPPPSVGTNVEDDYTFWDTDLANWYCDGGAGGVDTFRRDGCWGTITPMVRIELGGAVDDETGHSSVTGGGWWEVSPRTGRGRPDRGMLGLSARHHPKDGRLMGNLQLQIPSADLRLHVKDFDSLVVTDDTAVLSGSARVRGIDVEILLTVGDGTGPDGEDTVELVVREAGEDGEVLYDSEGPHPLGGGSLQIHR